MGFNGAAPFQERKAENDLGGAKSRVASMGPLPFRSGKQDPFGEIRVIFSLQWGRSLSGAERGWRFCEWFSKICFNGAAPFQERKAIRGLVADRLISKLQWGRSLSGAESPPETDSLPPARQASMGPLPFRSGKDRACRWSGGTGGASMGPLPFRSGKAGSTGRE